MKRTKRSLALTWLACASLALSLSGGILVMDKASAKNDKHNSAERRHRKVAHDLRDRSRREPQSNALEVIIQLNDRPSTELRALLRSNGVRIKKQYTNFNTIAVQLPASVIESLNSFPEVEFVSGDDEVRSLGGHVASTSGADDVRSLGTNGPLDGNGVGIAIVDSGIYQDHVAFLKVGTTQSRIVMSVDFTGEGRTDDPYGHGTHVASAAAGNGLVANGRYIGIAPKANIINLRVLNSQGVGTVSGLLAALDWLMSNRGNYNIRVVNMSLGMAALNSYKDDPVCVASRKLVDAGVVVFAAAGNNGKNGAGEKMYGHVHSPGIEPSVITVGAVDTKGTNGRGDDGIATYSSRGPTRGSWTDDLGPHQTRYRRTRQ
jgi:serine protease AprX